MAGVGLMFGLPAAVEAHPQAAGYTSPARIALRPADMSGFAETGARGYTDAQADKVDGLAPGTLERHGRLAGYDTTFQRSSTSGLLDVSDSIIVFRTAAGAQWQFQTSQTRALLSYSGSKVHDLTVGRLGDNAAGYMWTGKSNGVPLQAFVVLVRRGRYDAAITGAGLPGASGAGQVLHLAHLLDTRMKAAH